MSAEKLRVLSVSPSDVGGGAERIARDLHLSYLSRGVDSWLAVALQRTDTPNTVRIPNDEARGPWARAVRGPGRETSRLRRVLAQPGTYARVARGHENFDAPATAALLDLPPVRPRILQLHNLHGAYFDIRALPQLTHAVPTIATLHDAWLLTGHCAHPLGCERWRTGCGQCPHLDTYVPLRADASADNYAVRRRAVAASRLHVATPSQWLMRMVEASPLAESFVECRVIPNGIDTSVFSPGDRSEARRALGLPPGRRIALFAAAALERNQFKDFATLAAALPRIKTGDDQPVLLVALGARGPVSVDGADVLGVPFETDPGAVADYYRAADVYVHPARAENLPLAPIEAMACGTPVVASEVGGIPEILTDGESGLLVPVGAADALAAAVTRVLADAQLRAALMAAALDRVQQRFTLERQTDAYLDWYAELLG